MFSPRFKGITFSQAAQKIYREFNAILFAMEIGSGDGSRLMLNPGQLKIPSSRDTPVYGYIIAGDREVAEDISKFEVINTEADLGKGAMRGLTRIEDLSRLAVAAKSGSNTPLLQKTMTNITTIDSDTESSEEEEGSEVGTPNKTDSHGRMDKANSTLSIGLSEI
jgi:hypothetical protein